MAGRNGESALLGDLVEGIVNVGVPKVAAFG